MYVRLDREHTPLDITDEQRANLHTLSAHLFSLPEGYEHFTMVSFFGAGSFAKGNYQLYEYADRADIERIHECDSVACAIGHGPIAGIAPEHAEEWTGYSERVFTGPRAGTGSWDAWYFMFDGDWGAFDDTHTGAAHRIQYVLMYGVPALDEHDPVEEYLDALNYLPLVRASTAQFYMPV